jgi:hypothetical protein
MKNTIERIEKDVKNSLDSYLEFVKSERGDLNKRDVEMYKNGVVLHLNELEIY